MKLFIGWITAITVLASPCAWDTSQRELLDRLQQKSAPANKLSGTTGTTMSTTAITIHDTKESA